MTATEFALQHGRLPHLGGEVPPWKYRGWLLPYVVAVHAHSGKIPDRWNYHLETIAAGKLLDGPIPKLQFSDTPDRAVMKDIETWMNLIGSDPWDAFRSLIDWLLWGLGLGKEEARLTDDRQEKLYRTVNLGPMIEHPHDHFGQVVCEHKASGWNPNAFFPTPHSIVHLMVNMTMGEGKDARLLSVCDPCVGSGRMLLYASNYSLCLFGQDIDPLMCALTKINGALYAPWLAFPLPHSITGHRIEPPPATLPIPDPPKQKAYRVDDRASLFDMLDEPRS